MAQSFPVLLVRHAPVLLPEGVCYGRQDVALRPGWEGLASGLAVLAQGAVCRVLYSSPAMRCREMAQKLAAATGMELKIDDRLAELDFGRWEGMNWQEISRAQLDEWAADPARFAPLEEKVAWRSASVPALSGRISRMRAYRPVFCRTGAIAGAECIGGRQAAGAVVAFHAAGLGAFVHGGAAAGPFGGSELCGRMRLRV